ncbi:hypothetical protein EDB85DRAFT_2163220 [Lactarius pseudohatsudake]|nr:hypothetical protein EDB85DRAFT_2163220 [Lactarius pseudohatsudake]
MPIVVCPETPEPTEVVSDETSHFDYPGSDIVLRTSDSHDFRVPKLNIDICSPILRKLIRSVSNPPDVSNGALPVIELPENKATLYSLLTFIFPITPILPSTTEKIMELLAVAQKYQMDSVMTHIRSTTSRQDPPFIRPETALHVYFLAQEHKLRQEALQAARVTLRLPMVIEDLGDKLDFPGMTGAYLHELWKYHQQVRTDLDSGFLEFRSSGLPDGVKNLRCTAPRTGRRSFPRWLSAFIDSIAEAPHLFDLIEFEDARARHLKDETSYSQTCSCADISSQVTRAFWEALSAVFHGTIEKADSALSLMKEPNPPKLKRASVSSCLDLPDANIIVRSSDGVDFRVHKPVLAVSSLFFKDLLSLPQPPDDEHVDSLPVIQLSEDADLLNSLVSLLYPLSPVIPSSYEKVFALLAACQKYDMESVQSNIRDWIKLGRFPGPVEAEAFRACAIAGSMGLDPELEDAARLTLRYPMTFESLGEQLRSFNGRALYDLIRYRKGGNNVPQDDDSDD